MTHHVIYIPGILDDIAYVQSTLVRLWRLHGVRGHTHSIPWAGSDSYSDKEHILLAYIEALSQSGAKISLVGASAGATAVVNCLIARSNVIISAAVICPKLNNSNNVSTKLVEKNPAFMESLIQLESNLNALSDELKAKLTIFTSPRDGIIPRHDSQIQGVDERRLPALRHNAAILYSLSFGFPEILATLRRKEVTA